MEVASEVGKELVFGGAAGLVAGLTAKMMSTHSVGMVLGGAFVLMRAAIFDGQHLATWSPLDKDDASFPVHMKRVARREAFGVGRRAESFTKENAVIIAGFAVAYIVAQSV